MWNRKDDRVDDIDSLISHKLKWPFRSFLMKRSDRRRRSITEVLYRILVMLLLMASILFDLIDTSLLKNESLVRPLMADAPLFSEWGHDKSIYPLPGGRAQ